MICEWGENDTGGWKLNAIHSWFIFVNVNAMESLHSKENCILYRKYFMCLHKTDTWVFTIPSATRQAKFHLSSTNIAWISLSAYVIYSLAAARAAADE